MKILGAIRPLWAGAVTLILGLAGIVSTNASWSELVAALQTPFAAESIVKYLPCLGALLAAILTGMGLLSKNASSEEIEELNRVGTAHHQDTREMIHHTADANKNYHQKTQTDIAEIRRMMEEEYPKASAEDKKGFETAIADIMASRDARDAPAQEAIDGGRFEEAADYLLNISRQEGAAIDDMSKHAAENARRAGDIYKLTNVSKAIEAYEQSIRYDGQQIWDYIELSRAYVKNGDLGLAQKTLESAKDIPHQSDRGRCAVLSDFGDIAVARGDLEGAGKAYQASLDIAEKLAASDPKNTAWQRDLSVSHNKLGDIAKTQGDLEGARKAYQASLDIREKLAASDPKNTAWQRDLSVSHNKLGDIAVAQGDLEGAGKAYQASLDIREKLAASNPKNTAWQRDLSVSHNKLGDMAVAQGDLEGAHKAYQASLDIREKLAASDPKNTDWQRDLFVSHNKLGDIAVAQGDLEGARKAYQAGLDIAEKLAASDPKNTDWQRDLSVSHNKLGSIAVTQGDFEKARKAYQADLNIAEKLAASDPKNTAWQRDLIISYVRLSEIFPNEAKSYVSQALSVVTVLSDTGRLMPVDLWMVDDLQSRLDKASEM